MNPIRRWAQWAVVGTAVLLLFWVAATVGGWSPDVRRLTTSVHGPLVADYRADSTQTLAPLSPDITQDAAGDQTTTPPPSTSPQAGPSPSGSGTSPTPSGSGILPPTPSLPTPSLPTPSLPTTLPIPTPSVTLVTPSLPTALPSLPTPPPLP